MKQQNLLQSGFTLVEMIITLAILSFGIIGIYSAFNPVVYASYNLSSHVTASYLTQEGMEIIRNIRDNNFITTQTVGGETPPWYNGLDACSLGCQADYKTGTATEGTANHLQAYNDNNYLSIDGVGLSYSPSDFPTRFKRKITITMQGSDAMKVDVLVTWTYNGKPFSQEAVGYLYNWY